MLVLVHVKAVLVASATHVQHRIQGCSTQRETAFKAVARTARSVFLIQREEAWGDIRIDWKTGNQNHFLFSLHAPIKITTSKSYVVLVPNISILLR